MNRLDDHDWGLEDRILRKNIPGRFSWWDKDGDEEGPNARAEWLDPESDEAAAEAQRTDAQRMQWCAENDIPQPVAQSAYARQHGAQTGPKGVLNDYRQHQREEWADKQAAQQHREAVLHRMAHGTIVAAPPPVAEEDSESEDEFVKAYRAERRRELRGTSSHPVFGAVREVTAFQLLDELDKEDIRVFVVVHVYDERVQCCRTMNRCIETLARSHSRVKFVRLPNAESPQQFDEIAFPVLSVYRAGDLCDTFVRTTDKLGESFTPDDVEWLLSPVGLFDEETYNHSRRQPPGNSTVTVAAQALARATETSVADAIEQTLEHTQELFQNLSEDEEESDSS